MIKYEQPVAWFFMHRGQIKCKNKSNLTFEKIKAKFITKKSERIGIVATFMREVESENTKKYVKCGRFMQKDEGTHEFFERKFSNFLIDF